LNTWLGDTPWRRLTDDTLCPGTRVSSTILRLSSAEYLDGAQAERARSPLPPELVLVPS